MPSRLAKARLRRKGVCAVIKYVYEIDYPVGQKRAYLEWVLSSIVDTLQAPGELKRLASYDNVFSATPHRVVEFTFDSLEDAVGAVLRAEGGQPDLSKRTAIPWHQHPHHGLVAARRLQQGRGRRGAPCPRGSVLRCCLRAGPVRCRAENNLRSAVVRLGRSGLGGLAQG